jgi:hypothetical protein
VHRRYNALLTSLQHPLTHMQMCVCACVYMHKGVEASTLITTQDMLQQQLFLLNQGAGQCNGLWMQSTGSCLLRALAIEHAAAADAAAPHNTPARMCTTTLYQYAHRTIEHTMANRSDEPEIFSLSYMSEGQEGTERGQEAQVPRGRVLSMIITNMEAMFHKVGGRQAEHADLHIPQPLP